MDDLQESTVYVICHYF